MSDVLVIGGGVTGMEVARNLSGNGCKIYLIEKEAVLGGMVNRLDHLYPEGMPNAHTLQPLIEKIQNDENIEIMTNTVMVNVLGDIGNYTVKVKTNGSEKDLAVNAIVVATGLMPYDISNIIEYGAGKLNNVMSPITFEEMISTGEIDADKLKSVVIVNCAGSRDVKYLPHCSRVCCFIGLKEAKLIKDKNPDTEVYVTYMDMRSYGFMEKLYNTLKDDCGVNFINGRPAKITENDGVLNVMVEDITLDKNLKIKADYVILSHGYNGDEETLSKLGIPLDEGDKGTFPTTYCNAALSVDSNPRGIFVCGAAAYPKNVAEAITDARSVAMSVINNLKDIEIKNPVAEINSDICSSENCEMCLSVCPYEAIIKDEEGKMKIIESLCMGCGICIATCGAGANQLIGGEDLIEEIENIDCTGKTVAFLCKWSAYPAYESGQRNRDDIVPIKVPCTGRINVQAILKAFSKNAKGVLISGCYLDACHYNTGNFKAVNRVLLTKRLLEQFGICGDKLAIEWIGISESNKLGKVLDKIDERCSQ